MDKVPVDASRIFTQTFAPPDEPVLCTDIDADAFYLDNVLSKEECDFLIARTEECGYLLGHLHSIHVGLAYRGRNNKSTPFCMEFLCRHSIDTSKRHIDNP